AMIMVHGDDRGLRVPPKMAPIEAVFVPIVRKGDERAVAACHQAATSLREAGFRVKVDDRDQQPGWKYAEWDLRGVPLRIEIGPRDVDAQTVVLVRRDRAKGDPEQKKSVPISELAQEVRVQLDAIQLSLFDQAKAFLESHTFRVSDRDEFYEKCRSRAGMVDIAWCARPDCEEHVKEQTGATTRNTYPLPANEAGAPCVACGEPAVVRAYFAQSY
ncbi:MAG TPA: His/Gly/Thr/Pro-type tRNA ligase C-terminal domain-containing protein, partial [Alphaproteobacteria bacterium]|nr:His/Gly/Thr/Pro-type tRNA ligase C-terminal domain-containing protein [Alphaproteobacteria bacterium]